MEKETSEIVKLTERVAKDPKSKLFVPLAEEYRKTGDIEMAIYVLTEGLKNNPGYVTARSTLGRLYLEQGNLASAQKELEEVITVIPDNLLAQRKLGDIYVLQGKTSEALQRFKACLALNPDDKELIATVADLEAGRDISTRIVRPKVAKPPETMKPASASAPVSPKTLTPGRPLPAVPAAGPGMPLTPTPPERPVEAKPSSFIAPAPAVQQQQKGSDIVSPVEPAATQPSVSVPSSAQPTLMPVDEAEVVEEIVELEPLDQNQEAVTAPDSVMTEAPEVAELGAPLDLETPISVSDVSTFDLSEPGAEAAEAAREEQQPPVPWGAIQPEAQQVTHPAVAEESVDDISTNTLADLYLAQGFYDKAIEIYRGILADHPENEMVREKLAMIMAKAGLTERNASQPEQSAPDSVLESSLEAFAGSDAGRPTTGVLEPGVPETVIPQTGQPDRLTETTTTAPPGPSEGPERLPQEQAPQAEEMPRMQTVSEERNTAHQEPTPDVTQGPLSHTARRKETLDRLEHWLKNIMKEKP